MLNQFNVSCMDSFFPNLIPSLLSSTILSVMARSFVADGAGSTSFCYVFIVTLSPPTVVVCLHIKHRFSPEITS